MNYERANESYIVHLENVIKQKDQDIKNLQAVNAHLQNDLKTLQEEKTKEEEAYWAEQDRLFATVTFANLA